MTPYELISAGLSACTVITLQMYANKKSLPLDEVKVSIEHSKIKNAEMPSGFEDTFTRHIVLRGDLTAAQENKLLEIADKCPVHKTLHQPSQIVTILEK
jgi:putative redox protein